MIPTRLPRRICFPFGVAGLLLIVSATASGQAPTPSPTVRFGWPLAWPMGHPRLRITNYPDHDPGTGFVDYMNGDLSYDGHRGTDINLNSFRDMDEGVPVLAAADGRVWSLHDGEYDRQTAAPNLPANYVALAHENGIITLYYHLRTNSVTVQLGEYVRKGQMLGLVGSSGLTMMPHLHFEVYDPSTNSARDPWNGTNNPEPSLWEHQEDYVGDDRFHVHDLGVATGSAFYELGGFFDLSAFKERPSQPVVFGADEPTLRIWDLVSGRTGAPYALEIHRPDGSSFAHIDAHVLFRARLFGQGWQYWEFPFSGSVSPEDYGRWSAQIATAAGTIVVDSFTVGETSVYAPRFHWADGRSFHLSNQRQQDVPEMSYLGAAISDVSFVLENAPTNVSLSIDGAGQPTVLIDPAGPELASVRSREFALVATDPSGLKDRMHYHLVNYAASTLGSPPAVASPGGLSAYQTDTVMVDVSASDPDGDAISELTADLSGLPAGHGASFVAGSGNATGRLVWPTKAGQAGAYAVRFTAMTSFGAAPPFYLPIRQSGLATTSITVASDLATRAFTVAGDKTIRLNSGKPRWCVYVEPMNGRFGIADINPERIELLYSGGGVTTRISPLVSKTIAPSDKDHDSIEDLGFCFAGEDFRRLFSGVTGRQSVVVTLAGRLFSGARFSASVDLDVVGGSGVREAVRISPNPLNPDAILSLDLAEPGPVRVRLYDTQGRLVRTLLDVGNLPAGPLELRVEAKDDRGQALGSGVYFYRVTRRDGETAGRFVVLK